MRAFTQPCHLVRALLREYEGVRTIELSEHGQRNLVEAVELLRLYFEDSGVRVVDLRDDAAAYLVDGVTSLDSAIRCLEDLRDPFLTRVLPAEREFSRVVLAIARDFSRWLRGRALPRVERSASQGAAH
ncbi:MAG: hypothetical protein H6713_08490 [Myxococcales bacterium]|nr:hypothetical protein [Myxococcales bacterium]MCB9750026.1 hypothetical protein [Myxococcales bacterium]